MSAPFVWNAKMSIESLRLAFHRLSPVDRGVVLAAFHLCYVRAARHWIDDPSRFNADMQDTYDELYDSHKPIRTVAVRGDVSESTFQDKCRLASFNLEILEAVDDPFLPVLCECLAFHWQDMLAVGSSRHA